MKDFLKENIAIVAAIALPLLLVVVFMLSTAARNVAVEDPKHDFLIATNYQHSEYDAVRFDVVDGTLAVTYRYPYKDEYGGYRHNSTPRLWRVHVGNDMATEEISLPLPKDKDEESKKSVALDVPGVKGLKISTIQPGPDGYRFDNSSRHYYGSPMAELFSYDRYDSRAALVKDGRAVPLRGVNGNDFGYNTQFIGWIVEDGQSAQ